MKKLIFSSLFLLLHSAWANPPLIQLPPLDTDEDKITFLNHVRKSVPALFADAANYDIDLMGILEDEKKLMDLLKIHPEYAQAFENKSLVRLKITPPTKGLEIKSTRIEPGVIQQWKAGLIQVLGEITEGLPPLETLSISVDHLLLEQFNKHFPVLAGPDSQKILKSTFSSLSQVKQNQSVLNRELRNANSQSDRMKLIDQLITEGTLTFQNVSTRTETLQNIRSYFEKTQAEKQVAAFIELYLTLPRNEHGIKQNLNFDEVKTHLESLDEGTLTALADQEDVTKPRIAELLKQTESFTGSEVIFEKLVNLLNIQVQIQLSKTETKKIKVTDPIELEEVAPSIGIFRGCTGGDCSSQFSFPYPNDPNERVFFIHDKDHALKGYVSSTLVNANGKKSLYIITVAGKRVNAADTELIFRGLDQEKAALGVDQIVLPNEVAVSSLINFTEPRGIYMNYVQGAKTVGIHYNNPEIRKIIESYESPNNHGSYDHMSRNSSGVVLKLPKLLPNQELTTQLTLTLPSEVALSPVSTSDALEFALDMESSNRQPMARAALKMAGINRDRFRHAMATLSNSQKLSIHLFDESVKQAFQQLGLEPKVIEERKGIFLKGRLLAPDAFSSHEVETTAEMLTKILKTEDSSLANEVKDSIHKNLNELKNTNAFSKHLKKLGSELLSGNTGREQKASEQIQSLGLQGLVPELPAYLDRILSEFDPKNSTSSQLVSIDQLFIYDNLPNLPGGNSRNLLLKEKMNQFLESIQGSELSYTSTKILNTFIISHQFYLWKKERDQVKRIIQEDSLKPQSELNFLHLILSNMSSEALEEKNSYRKWIFDLVRAPDTPRAQIRNFMNLIRNRPNYSWSEFDPWRLKFDLEEFIEKDIVSIPLATTLFKNPHFKELSLEKQDQVRQKLQSLPKKISYDFEVLSLAKAMALQPIAEEWPELNSLLKVNIRRQLRSPTDAFSHANLINFILDQNDVIQWSEERELVHQFILAELEKPEVLVYLGSILKALDHESTAHWSDVQDKVRHRVSQEVKWLTGSESGNDLYFLLIAMLASASNHWDSEFELLHKNFHQLLEKSESSPYILSLLALSLSKKFASNWHQELNECKTLLRLRIENFSPEELQMITAILIMEPAIDLWREEVHTLLFKASSSSLSNLILTLNSLNNPPYKEPKNNYILQALSIEDDDARKSFLENHIPKAELSTQKAKYN